MRRIVAILPRLTAGKVGRFARTDVFLLALDVAEIELARRGEPLRRSVRAGTVGVAGDPGGTSPRARAATSDRLNS